MSCKPTYKGRRYNSISEIRAQIREEIVKRNNMGENTSSNNGIMHSIEGVIHRNEVNYRLKSIDILSSKKAEQVFAKGKKNGWNLNKILTELQIPKEQKQIILDKGTTDRDNIVTSLLADNSYIVQVKTAKIPTVTGQKSIEYDNNEEVYSPSTDKIYVYTEELGWLSEGKEVGNLPNDVEPTKSTFVQNKIEDINTQHYSNLTVPGGTNYTENRIITPQIVPNIKGHPKFAEDNDIGWFRSDEQGTNKELIEGGIGDDGFPTNFGFNNEYRYKSGSKTRRILEIQSDLFQKGRNKEDLLLTIETRPDITNKTVLDKINQKIEEDDTGFGIGNEITIDGITYERNVNNGKWRYKDFQKVRGDEKGNQFLQLLNKNNNWVTFFINAIIQDSAKKGYEKVLFPKGETAAKIEGHETIADEIKRINSEIESTKKTLAKPKEKRLVNFSDKYLQERINKFEKEKANLKAQGIEKLKPIENFYENVLSNILNKQFGKENVNIITDEYGNKWNEIDLTSNKNKNIIENNILLSLNDRQSLIKDKSLNNSLARLLNPERGSKGIKAKDVLEILVNHRIIGKRSWHGLRMIRRTDENNNRFQNKNNNMGMKKTVPQLEALGKIRQINAEVNSVFGFTDNFIIVKDHGVGTSVTINQNLLNIINKEYNNENNKYSKLFKSRNVTEALDNIIDGNFTKYERDLAFTLKNLAHNNHLNVKVKFISNESMENIEQGEYEDGTVFTPAELYDSKNREITINTKTSNAATILHEIVHAVTVDAINSPSKEAKLLRNLFTYFKSISSENNQYGFKNVYEFVAEMMSNVEFRDHLNSLPALDKNRFASFFSQMIDAINRILNKLFNGKINNESALYESMVATMNTVSVHNDMLNHLDSGINSITDGFDNLLFSSTPREQSNHFNSKGYGIAESLEFIEKVFNPKIKYNNVTGEAEIEAKKDDHKLTNAIIELSTKLDNQVEMDIVDGKTKFKFLNNSDTIDILANLAKDGSITASEALSSISKTNTLTGGEKALYDIVSNLVSAANISTKIVFLNDAEMRHMFSASSSKSADENSFSKRNTVVNGKYVESENTIYINRNKASKLTLYHELLHASTSKYLSVSNSVAVNKLREIYKKISNMNEFRNMHEVSNFDEFLVGLYGSPSFVSALINSKELNNKTLYHRILEAISNIIKYITGGKEVSNTALNKILNISNDVISEATKFRAEGTIKTGLGENNIDTNFSSVLTTTLTDGGNAGISFGAIDDVNASDAGKLFAIYTIAKGNVQNDLSIAYLAAQIASMPISNKFEGLDIESMLKQKFGLNQNNLTKSQQTLVNTAYKLASKKLSTLSSKTFNDILDKGINNVSELRVKASADANKTLYSLSENDVEAISKEVEETIATRLNEFKRKGYEENVKNESIVYKNILKNNTAGNFLQSIVSFMDSAESSSVAMLSEFNRISNKIKSSDEQSVEDLNTMAIKLQNMVNFNNAYLPILSRIRYVLRGHNEELTNSGSKAEYVETLNALYRTSANLTDVDLNITELNKKVVAAALSKFSGSYKGNLKDLLDKNEDISWFRLWLTSAADSGNDLLTLSDYATKHFLENARMQELAFSKIIKQTHQKLIDSGITDTSFMYEKDAEGKYTGNFISKFNRALYAKDRKAAFRKIDQDSSLSEADKETFRIQWLNEANSSVGKMKYSNTKNFKKALDTKAKKDFYDAVMANKRYLNSFLPKNLRHEYRAPQITQDLTEYLTKVARGEDTTSLKEQIASSFIRTSDDLNVNPNSRIERDNEYKQKTFSKKIKKIHIAKSANSERISNITLDQNGSPSMGVPVHFITNIKSGNLSTDVVQGMVAFASSVFRYSELNKILHVLELERTILKDSTKIIKRDSFGNKLKSTFKIEDKEYSKEIIEAGTSNLYKRLEGYIDANYYGNMTKAGKDITLFGKKINPSKMSDKFGMYVAVNALALNIYAGIQNPIVAEANLRIEASGGEHFDHKNLLVADKILATELPGDIAEKLIDTRLPENKLSLWIEHFNTLQKGAFERADINSGMKNIFLRMFKTSTLFVVNNIGEYYVQTKLSLALADRYKVKDSSGKEISLYDAFEVSNKNLVLKKGIKKLDGTPFTEEDKVKFIIKQNHINNDLNGIYNEIDRNLFQRVATGRLVLMFRKFMIPGAIRRFDKASFDFSKDMETEGYYRSTGILLKNIALGLNEYGLNVAVHWNKLSNHQKRNVFRTLNEVAYIVAAYGLIAILSNIDGDDDKNVEHSYAYYMFIYQVYRFKSEIQFFINPNETIRLMQSPAAAVTQIDDLSNLIGDFLSIDGWTKKIRSGKNKGMTPVGKDVRNAIPMRKTLQSWAWPEDKLKFFTTN